MKSFTCLVCAMKYKAVIISPLSKLTTDLLFLNAMKRELNVLKNKDYFLN